MITRTENCCDSVETPDGCIFFFTIIPSQIAWEKLRYSLQPL